MAFDSVTGKGVQATVNGRAVLVGNARLLADAGIATHALGPVAAELSADAKTPVLAAVGGLLAVADPVKDDSAAAITALHRQGGWRCGTSSGLMSRKACDILDRLSGDR